MTYSRKVMLAVVIVLLLALIIIAVIIFSKLGEPEPTPPTPAESECTVGQTKCQVDSAGENTGIVCSCEVVGDATSYICAQDAYDFAQCPANIFTTECPNGTIYTGECAVDDCDQGLRPQYFCNPSTGEIQLHKCVVDSFCPVDVSSSSSESSMASSATTSQSETTVSSESSEISQLTTDSSTSAPAVELPDTAISDYPFVLIFIGGGLLFFGLLVNRLPMLVNNADSNTGYMRNVIADQAKKARSDVSRGNG